MPKQMLRPSLPASCLSMAILASLLVMMTGCRDDEPKWSETKAEDLFATPKPPDGWYPFKEGTGIKPEDYVDKLPIFGAAATCPNKVADPRGIVIRDTGKVVGNLKFNLKQRGKGGAKEANDGNTDLGPVFEPNSGLRPDWYHYKYEVEITFTPNLAQTFYGQMITDLFAIGSNPDVEFHDDTPANDYVGKKWFLKPSEKKTDYPVVEVQGNTVRWIDAPGGAGNTAGKMMFVIVYAGACGKLTHMKIFKLESPKKAKPTITHINPPDKLKDDVKSFKFRPA